MSEDLHPIGQPFLRAESRKTCYVPSDGPGERKCRSCLRKRYGGPSCCDEGWERMRGDDAGGCKNWTGWDADLAGPEPEPMDGGSE